MNHEVILEGTVRVAPLMSIPNILWEFGCDPEPIFEAAGLSTEQFTQPENEISFVLGSKLLEGCVEATGCDHFGLMIGERTTTSSLGVTGFMMRFAPNIRTALKALIDHLELHDKGGAPTLAIDGDVVQLGYFVYQPGTCAIDCIYDLSLNFICNIMRDLCGQHWNPGNIYFSRETPNNIRPYKKIFRGHLNFNAAGNYIEFPSHWLDYPIASADSELFSYLEKDAKKLHSPSRSTTLNSFHRVLLQAMVKRKCSAEYVAKQLGMHQRTLNRKLHEMDTTFSKELEHLRFEVAKQMLTNRELSINEIALYLCYSDQAAFSRAFKRWSSVAPSEWNHEHQA